MNPILRRLASLSLPCCLLGPLAAQDAKADAERLAACCNQFAADLHPRLGKTATPTSGPASIAFALLMLTPGARAATADELATVLHLPADLRGARLDAAVQKLLTTCGLGARPAANEKTAMRLVNAMWAQRGHAFVPAYVDTLRRSYGATHHLVDFIGATEGARRAINADVASATNDRIKELIPPDLLTAETRLVLTNAMWFKGAWQHPFAERRTKPEPFTRADGSEVTVSMMQLGEALPGVDGEAWIAVELPFADSEVRCEIVMPKAGHTLAEAELAMLRDAVRPALQQQQVSLRLPKFRVAAQHRLKEALIALGLPRAFTADADFSGIDDKEPLCIDEVVHQSWIQLDEAGAEAAAATAVVMKRAGAARDFIKLTFDHPFAFALRDHGTGLLLFAGRVDDPSTPAR